LKLFSRIASVIDILHKNGHFIPHLILDDIMVFEDENGKLEVKIDFKLSRFFDPKLDRPGPMLKHLLDCHADIQNGRPLDFKTDLGSLGKVFMELLTADYETCEYIVKIDELPLPAEIKMLFKTMLAKDADLRPRSLVEVVDVLIRVTPLDIEKAQRDHRRPTVLTDGLISQLRKRQIGIVVAVCLLFLIGGVIWYYFGLGKKENDLVLEDYANRYAPSIAFVMVEYWLKNGNTTYYHTKTEGTAFLVDAEGYLMTNRHVACPWLEDGHLFMIIYQLKQNGISPAFGYRIFLWFEGERAFNRSASVIDRPGLTDAYFIDNAFRTDGTPRLTIAGVAKPPVKTRQIIASPLRDDYAVLKIDDVPGGLKPLPLDMELEPKKIPKLSRVITLGFPLGSSSQSSQVNVSVVRGHIRRTFEDLIQVDASIYGGNSGGPLIDMRGKVIGIASGVAMEKTPVARPIWDMAMILPITKAVTFLRELKTGKIKWNGVLDLSVEAKIKEITDLAGQGDWAKAMNLVDKKLKQSSDPSLVMAGGMVHFCADDSPGAKRYFLQTLSMDPENQIARLMLFIIDWQEGRSYASIHRQELLALDWRSSSEFIGYLARILNGLIDEKFALKSWGNESEKSWLNYITGLMYTNRGDLVKADYLMQAAVLASNKGSWEFYLARAELDQIRAQRLGAAKDNAHWKEYQAAVKSFDQTVLKDQEIKADNKKKKKTLSDKLQQHFMDPKVKREILERIFELAPDNRDVLVSLAFYCAMNDKWEAALKYTRTFLKYEGRENIAGLSLGLLEGGLLNKLGRRKEAKIALEDFLRRVRDPWYRSLCECLLGRRTEESLTNETKENPENLMTIHTALGLWAEGNNADEDAIAHYKIALESFMDNWVEFEFAKERIKKLRAKEVKK